MTVGEFPQAQVLCKGGRQEQAGIGHQAVVIKDDADAVGGACVVAFIRCSFSWVGFLFQNPLSQIQRSTFFTALGR